MAITNFAPLRCSYLTGIKMICVILLEFLTTMSSEFRQSDSAILQHCDAHVLLPSLPHIGVHVLLPILPQLVVHVLLRIFATTRCSCSTHNFATNMMLMLCSQSH